MEDVEVCRYLRFRRELASDTTRSCTWLADMFVGALNDSTIAVVRATVLLMFELYWLTLMPVMVYTVVQISELIND
jgi:hypothetical protein